MLEGCSRRRRLVAVPSVTKNYHEQVLQVALGDEGKEEEDKENMEDKDLVRAINRLSVNETAEEPKKGLLPPKTPVTRETRGKAVPKRPTKRVIMRNQE